MQQLKLRTASSGSTAPRLFSSLGGLFVTLAAFSQTTNYDFNLQVTSSVYTLAVQPDGRILVGSIRAPLRLQTNGALDASFAPRLTNGHFQGTCYTIAVQDDGKILLGGKFNSMAGQSHTNLGRFNADGSLDNTFNAHATGLFATDGNVFSLAFDNVGRKLIGGDFTKLGGQPCSGLGRLSSADIPDTSFNPGDSNGVPFSLAVQADDRILVGGWFSSLAAQSRTNLGRLNPDGSLDSSFNPVGVDFVGCFAGQADGKILVGTTVHGPGGVMTNLVRFDTNGSLDAAFNPAPDSAVVSLAVQADGKIILGGLFTRLGGQPRMGIGRLNLDGTLDTNFIPRAYHDIYSLALQEDGKILVGGRLSDGSGQTNDYIGRLQNTSPATQSLTYDGSTITWMRGGTSPEVWRTSFQNSTDGSVWTELGKGVRVSGGWQLTNSVLPPGSIIRARGRVSAGQFNGTSWFVETKLQLPTPPKIIVDNGNLGIRSNQFGFDLTGPTNSLIVVESSLNLSTWTPLVTNTIQSSSVYFSAPATAPRSFYRLRLLQ